MTVRIEPNNAALTYIGRWQNMTLGGKNLMVAVSGGPRLRFRFTGTSLVLEFDSGAYTPKPELDVSIDGGAYSRVVLNADSKSIVTGLAPGTHTANIWVAGVHDAANRWVNFEAVRLWGIVLDDGASVSSWPLGQIAKMLVLGDSVAEGLVLLGATQTPTYSSGRLCFPSLVADQLGVEGWLHAFGGTGIAAGYGTIPCTRDNYLEKMNGYAHADPVFDVVLIEGVNNDSEGGTLQAYYETLIDRIRVNSPNAKIFCMGRVYPGPSDSASVQAAAAAKNATYISPVGWSYSRPNLNHPDAAGHAAIAAYLYPIIRTVLTKNLITGAGLGLPPVGLWTLAADLQTYPDIDPVMIRLKPLTGGGAGSDLFGVDTQQEMKTGGDGAKQYGWNLLNSGSADIVDVNITNGGKLTIDASTVSSSFWQASDNGAFVYKNVTGDFDFETLISDNGARDVEGCGLMARDPNASAGKDDVHIRYVYAGGARLYNWMSTVNSVSTGGSNVALNMPYQRLKRIGNDMYLYVKANAGDAWTLAQQITRADFGATIQVGLYIETNNTQGLYRAQFDYFQVTGGAMPTTGPVAETAWLAVPGGTINDISPLENFLGSGSGAIRYQYAVNNGAYNGTWLTVEQLKAAVRGTAITDHTNSVRIKVQFNSNGSEQATVIVAGDLRTNTLGGGGGGGVWGGIR